MVCVDFTIQNWIRFPGITPSLAMPSNPSICYILLRDCMSTFIQEYGFFLFKNTLSNSFFFLPSLQEKEEHICFILLQQRACCVLGVGHAGDKTQNLTHAPTPDEYLKASSAPLSLKTLPYEAGSHPKTLQKRDLPLEDEQVWTILICQLRCCTSSTDLARFTRNFPRK